MGLKGPVLERPMYLAWSSLNSVKWESKADKWRLATNSSISLGIKYTSALYRPGGALNNSVKNKMEDFTTQSTLHTVPNLLFWSENSITFIQKYLLISAQKFYHALVEFCQNRIFGQNFRLLEYCEDLWSVLRRRKPWHQPWWKGHLRPFLNLIDWVSFDFLLDKVWRNFIFIFWAKIWSSLILMEFSRFFGVL